MSTPEQRSKWREDNNARRDYRKQYNPNYYQRLIATMTPEEKKEHWKNGNVNRDQCNRKKYNLVHQYGLTFDQVKQMYVSQNGLCAICGNRFKNRRNMHVDHCHATNKVRQLLCCKCNLGLGYFNESVPLFLKVIEYLKKWNGA